MINVNYQEILDKILEGLKEKKRLLLHACCAPCSSYVLEYLSNYFDITIYYYNPNIAPDLEYNRRMNELKRFLNEFKTKNKVEFIEEEYNPNDFYTAISGLEHMGEKSPRCYKCYELRMDKAASYAKENGFDYFTTTLSISPYKNSTWINVIGEKLQDKYDIKYLYADFKKRNGYKRSLEHNLYRQDYCGCIYSKEAREKVNN